MKSALRFILTAGLLSSAVMGIGVYTVMTGSPSGIDNFDVNAFEVGHLCSNMQVQSMGYETLSTENTYYGSCLTNLNTINVHPYGNRDVSCNVTYSGVNQWNNVDGGVIVAAASYFSVGEDGFMCGSSTYLSYGGVDPVTSRITCDACTQEPANYTVDTIASIVGTNGGHSIDIKFYDDALSNSYCNYNSVRAQQSLTFSSHPTSDNCQAPPQLISLFSSHAITMCNISFTPALPHVATIVTSLVGDQICADVVLQSALTPVVATTSGCISCSVIFEKGHN